MNRQRLGFGLLTIFIVSLFFGSNINVLSGDKPEIIGENEVTPASDLVQGLGTMTPTSNNQTAYLKKIADWLVYSAIPVSEGVTWISGSEKPSGYYDGVAGVISFLAQMYQTTRNATYLEIARRAEHWLETSGEIKMGTGKYKESDAQPRNYTSLESGAAGIGESYLDLYGVTGNASYLTLAEQAAWWLLDMGEEVGEGIRWPYKEPITVTDGIQNRPDSIKFNYGSTGESNFNDLTEWDAATYDIAAVDNTTAYLADFELNFNTTQWGLYKLFNAEEEKDKFLNFEIQVTLSSNVNFASGHSNVSIVDGSADTDLTTINPSNFNTTVQSVEYTTTSSQLIFRFVRNLISGSQFRVRVKAAHASDFDIFINELNITVSYDDTAYYPDWSLGAAGIGQFFLDLYKVTSNITYYYTAANASRYLQDVAISEGSGVYWVKQGIGKTSIKDGVAGIGKFLVDLYKVNASDVIALNLAAAGANWTIEQCSDTIEGFTEDGESIGTIRRFEYSNTTSQDFRSGYLDGMAGIGDFLLDLAKVTAGPIGTLYLSAANETAAFLSAYTMGISGTPTLLDITAPYTYRWKESLAVNNFHNGSQKGVAGNLVFLSRYASLTGSKSAGTIVDGALRFLTAAPLQWNFSAIGNLYYEGCAGLGDCLLQVGSVSGTGMQVAIGGLNSLLIHENDTLWALSSVVSDVYSGMYQGVAGVGLAFLEGYQATGNDRFLNAATHAAERLSVLSAQTLHSSSSVTYWGKGDGIAGIADFLLEMFVATGNSTYKDWAESILYRLLAANKGTLDNAYWGLSDSVSTSYYTYRDGTAGIATTFLKAFQVTANSTYLRVAKGALVYLDYVDTSSGYRKSWNPSSGATTTFTGWDFGAAGIGYAYLQAFLLTGNQSYLESASGVALWLQARHAPSLNGWYRDGVSGLDQRDITTGSAGIVNFLLQLYATNQSTIISGEIDYGLNYMIDSDGIVTLTRLGWSTGLAGALGVLSQAVVYNLTLVLPYLEKNTLNEHGVQYLLDADFRESSGAWHVGTGSTETTTFSGIANGSAGIFRILASMPDLSRPTLSKSMNVATVNYDDIVSISITTSDAYSNISSVFLNVSYNNVPSSTIVATRAVGDTYAANIPAQAYGTSVAFMIVTIDESGQVTLDNNNSNYYRYTTIDNVDPQYSAINVYVDSVSQVAPGACEDAIFMINAIEPSGSSQVQSVVLYYSYDGGAYQTAALTNQPIGSNTYQTAQIAAGWEYSRDFSFYFRITDNAGNIATTSVNSTYIHDYNPPVISRSYEIALNRQEYPALTPLGITLNISRSTTDCEAAIPEEGGAFVLYTKNGLDWIRVNFTNPTPYTDCYIFTGSIPGMNMGDTVRFVLGAQDSAGNIAYMGSDKVLYTRFEDISASNCFIYTVSMNWLLFFVIVAIVAVVISMSYVLYMRRGGYWQRMRRTASTKATAISIQAKFASLYYWTVEKLQNIGIKLRKVSRKAGDKLGEFGAWAGERLGDRISRFLRAIGRGIADFFKGIGNAIVGIFGVLKTIIIKVRWYQVLVFVLVGLVLILLPVINWVLEQQYPLRAVFFMGMGLVIFITGFVVFIINLIYQISYK